MKQSIIDIVNDVAEISVSDDHEAEISNPREIVEDIIKAYFKSVWNDFDENMPDSHPKTSFAPSGREWLIKVLWENDHHYFVLDKWRAAGGRWETVINDNSITVVGFTDPLDLFNGGEINIKHKYTVEVQETVKFMVFALSEEAAKRKVYNDNFIDQFDWKIFDQISGVELGWNE